MQNQADLPSVVKLFRDVIASGDILNEDTLQTMPWSPFNIRYGILSIRGTLGEVWNAISWNQAGFKDKCLIVPSSKLEQVQGWDLSFGAPQWHYIYHGQSKTTTFENGCFSVSNDWMSYDPAIVDRLVFCNPKQGKGYCIDYPEFLKYLQNLNWTGSKLIISESVLLQQRFKFHLKALRLK